MADSRGPVKSTWEVQAFSCSWFRALCHLATAGLFPWAWRSVRVTRGARDYSALEVATALDLDPGTPVVLCDARDRESGKEVLITLIEPAGNFDVPDAPVVPAEPV